MAAVVGIKDLKDHLSEHLARVKRGERLLITDRGTPIASLAPVAESPEAGWAWDLVREGAASWRGGKPRGSTVQRKIRGKTTAAMVIEDRR